MAPVGSSADDTLRESARPDFEAGDRLIRSVDLFSGCGGLTLGIAQACQDAGFGLEIPLALDFSLEASSVYGANFPKATVSVRGVEDAFDGKFSDPHTSAEAAIGKATGPVHILVAGPPCQGHSDLNNHTRRNDPKNLLYLRVARAAEVLRPDIVLIENVPTVQHDKKSVVPRVLRHLREIGFKVADGTISMDRLSVAQRRRRHIVLGIKESLSADPAEILARLADLPGGGRDLRWAIGDLVELESPTGWDIPPRASAENIRRMKYLLAHDMYDLPNAERPVCHQDDNHTYRSMYGRLRWDAPAQTVTSGFGSIGQGRYMHPDKTRALTPHEAARIQGFPDYFDFSSITRRAALSTMIANAVPPQLAREIVGPLLPLLAAVGSNLAR